jgi:hypothetical protein
MREGVCAGETVPSPLGREGGGVFLLLPFPSLPIFPFICINDLLCPN